MNASEWTKVRDHVADLWGKTGKWATYGNLIRHVATCDYNTATVYVNSQIGAKYAPSPGDVIKASKPDASEVMARPGPDECERLGAGHRYGIVNEFTDGARLGMCSRCLLETRFNAGVLLTQGEIDTRRLLSQERKP